MDRWTISLLQLLLLPLVGLRSMGVVGLPPCLPGDREECLHLPARSPLLLPDLHTLPPYDFRLLQNAQTGARSIRFSNAVVNLGSGSMLLLGEFNTATQTVSVSQVIGRANGLSIRRSVGELTFEAEHAHWHWDDFSVYEVWSVDARGELERHIISSGKVGYCLRDNQTYADFMAGLPAPQTGIFNSSPAQAEFRSCSWQRQGVSPGWLDVYANATPGQIIHLGGAPDGLYALKSTVDPRNRLAEADDRNNTAVTYFSLMGTRLVLHGAELPEQLP